MSTLDQLSFTSASHSATVTMAVHTGAGTYRVLQSSKHAIKVNDQIDIPCGDAVLETSVDGRPHLRNIRILPESPWSNWIGIEDRD